MVKWENCLTWYSKNFLFWQVTKRASVRIWLPSPLPYFPKCLGQALPVRCLWAAEDQGL
ncbi:hypothetical protein EJ02DRAFT_449547, partial [Clathrospora elynae]